MRHFALFDEKGNRITTFVEDIHFKVVPGYEIFDTDGNNEQVVVGYEPEQIEPPLPDGFVEITEEEQSLYITGKYIRGSDGKPTEKVATADEILALTKVAKFTEIENKLKDTDYKCLKFIDGELTAEEYAETKELRQTLRAAYNEIEAAATLEELNAVVY